MSRVQQVLNKYPFFALNWWLKRTIQRRRYVSRKQITPNSVRTRYAAVRSAVVMLLTPAEDGVCQSQEAGPVFHCHHFNMRKPKLRDSWELAKGPTVGKWRSQALSSALPKTKGYYLNHANPCVYSLRPKSSSKSPILVSIFPPPLSCQPCWAARLGIT